MDSSNSRFFREVMHGLKQANKTLPCKYFYDDRGSQLFTKICTTPEYYVTRTELAIMQQYRHEMAAKIGENAQIVEFGSGAGEKIRLLLDALASPQVYTPLDISEEILQLSAQDLQREFPNIIINPVVGDYTESLSALKLFPEHQHKNTIGKRIVYFPGSTLSNFTPAEAVLFLKKIRQLTRNNGGLLIGVDLIKDAARLNAAYNDKSGYTEAFNLNVLEHINRKLDANFDTKLFTHHAYYNEAAARIEMHLVSSKEQTVTIANQIVSFKKDESIHTENSYKYSLDSFAKLAQNANFSIEKTWTDNEPLFSVHYLS